MHIFNGENLLYLSFHAIGFLFCFISVLGIPGNIDETPITKLVEKIADYFMLVAWYGIPYLLVGSVIAFYFDFTIIGKIMSIISLTSGLGLFISMVVLYQVK